MDSCAGFPGHFFRYRAGQARATCACGALVDVPYASVVADLAPAVITREWCIAAAKAEQATGDPDCTTGRALTDEPAYRAGLYFGTLQRIMQVLGPTAPDCAGCAAEIAEALRLLRAAGVEYLPRKAEP